MERHSSFLSSNDPRATPVSRIVTTQPGRAMGQPSKRGNGRASSEDVGTCQVLGITLLWVNSELVERATGIEPE
jgi:hypothetical protein